MKAVIQAVMAADAIVNSLLTGGAYTEIEISRQKTPAAFDASTKKILPCANIKVGQDSAAGPNDIASRQLVDIYFFEQTGTATIDQVLKRTYEILHRQKIGTAADGIFELRWVTDIRDQEDQALLASMSLSRYEVVRYRG